VISDGWKRLLCLGIIALAGGCTQSADRLAGGLKASSVRTKAYSYTTQDKECLARAMFFESNRSSREGLVAVGTVVMNRLQSGIHGDTVCSVVGEKGQFAPGVLSRPMDSAALPDVQSAADAVLKGERHPRIQSAMYFHAAGRHYPYKNMHYVLVAGGNAFYEKRSRLPAPRPAAPAEAETAVASAAPVAAPAKIEVASASPNSRAVAGGNAFYETRRRPPALQPAAPVEVETAVASAAPAVAPVNAKPAKIIMASASPNSRAAPKGDRLVAAASPRMPALFETVASPAQPAQADIVPDVEQASFSFETSPEEADAIGAMLLNQSRPLEP
jgi:hypothetical protein